MDYSLVIVAALGGLAVNLLNLAEVPQLPADKRPNFRDPVYWATFPIGALLGGFVGYVYVASEFNMNAVLAAQIGASAPLILKAMASAIPKNVHLEAGA